MDNRLAFYFKSNFQFHFYTHPIWTKKQSSSRRRYSFSFIYFDLDDSCNFSPYEMGGLSADSIFTLGFFCHNIAINSGIFKSQIVTAADGSQSDDCLFPDGSKCGEWAFFRSECQKGKDIKFESMKIINLSLFCPNSRQLFSCFDQCY